MNEGQRQSHGRLERVRGWRVRDRQPVAIGQEVQALQRHLERSARRTLEFITVWEQIIPAHLVAKTRVKGARGGVFQVAVGDSAILFEIDRLLREGALADMRMRLQGTLVRIKLAVEPLIDAESERQ